ncbi:MAG: hypothetical protein WBP16_05485 [Ferruginibacter sp.]
MKHCAPYALSLLLSVIALTGFSQNNPVKPKQFNSFPDVINCNEAELSKVFNSPSGQTINLSFSDNFTFSGNVTSNIVKYANLQTAVIVSPDYSNTIFSVSKIANDDGSTSYIGRIINKKYFDGFELKRNQSGNYQLVKMETDRFIQDCYQN